jgi:CDP-2,3-bis-(O-geranylgeranyl)-sn-glycerol synthase
MYALIGEFVDALIHALYFIFPAYCANAAPVIFGGGLPIDAGRTFVDGKPIFGSHKTVRGFLAGLIIGTLVGFAGQFVLSGEQSAFLGFVLSLGALVGDLVDSFIKRRLGIGPGSPVPLADQLDFVLGALVFSLGMGKVIPTEWVLLILIVTPPIHLLTNGVAYLLGAKKKTP